MTGVMTGAGKIDGVELPQRQPENKHASQQETLCSEQMAAEIDSVNPFVSTYTRFLTKFPYIIPIVVEGLTIGCGWHSIKEHPPPDFSEDPTEGFETRGTKIQIRALTLENLYNHEDVDVFLVPNQTVFAEDLGIPLSFLDLIKRWRGKRSLKSQTGHMMLDKAFEGLSEEDSHSQPQKMVRKREADNIQDSVDKCFPKSIFVDVARFVLEPTDGKDLLSAKKLQGICAIDRDHIRPNIYPSCELRLIPHVVSQMKNKICDEINDDDVSSTRHLLADCAPFYYNGSLTLGRDENDTAPPECKRGSFVHKMFYFLVPFNFMKKGNREERLSEKLLHTLAYVDNATQVDDWQEFYEANFKNLDTSKNGVRITAMHLPGQEYIKFDIFNEYLLHDMWYFLLAACLIILIMMLYLHSVVLTLATVINVGISFVLAYTIYFALPQVNFFPFMNLLTALVLIAVGADDVFIFHDAWEQAKCNRVSFHETMAVTFTHAASSVFVTSVTTAAAFFANIISDITAIKCFGIFAGIAILVNFLLMITWTPSVIVCIEHVWTFVTRKFCPSIECNCLHVFTRASDFLYKKVFPCLVEKAWFVWIFLLVGVGVGGCIVVFVIPKLNLPTTQEFQLFPAGNLLEQWDLNFQNSFQAVIDQKKDSRSQDIPLYVVWGFKPADTGNPLDPDNKGSDLIPDPTFSFYSTESQVWLEDFCQSLKNSSFAPSYYNKAVCSYQLYENILREFCGKYRSYLLSNLSMCCEKIYPPFDPGIFERCLPGLQLLVGQDTYDSMGTPLFDSSNKVVGFLMYMKTSSDMSMSYDVMDGFYKEIETFINHHLEDAPSGIKGAFFSSWYQFTFYDLQRAISNGTYYSIILSLSVAFLMIFCTSLNILVTVYAVLTIGLAIICTVAAIVLMGWDLNILESITISLAVGLSIDFAIHYGVAYRLSRGKTSVERVNEGFYRVGSAVAMAALTTFCAGAAMMRSNILAYTKLGIFLMLVMTFSWVYSTFLFQSICRIIGPRGNFCQLSLDCFLKRKKYSVSGHCNLNSLHSNDSILVTFR